MDWISVEDELPKKSGLYVCLESDEKGRFKRPAIYCWSGEGGDCDIPPNDWNNYETVVTHWIPLPKSLDNELNKNGYKTWSLDDM
jgi:hypothetical protein